MANDKFKPVNLFYALWVVLGVFAMISYVRVYLAPGGWWQSILFYLSHALVLLLIALFFALALSALVWGSDLLNRAPTGAGLAFPAPITLGVALWLLLFAVASVAGVFLCLYPPNLPAALKGVFRNVGDQQIGQQASEALIMMFAAGVGASITAMLAFLLHASEQKNFDRAYVAWYLFRPLNGMLLGLIFYALIRGGLLLTVSPNNGQSQALQNLNDWSLAGIGALVGLFSKNATEKLREVFNNLFRTEEEIRRLLRGVSEDARKKLLDLLPEEVKQILIFGTGEEMERALRSLPPEVKAKLEKDLPAEMASVLRPYLTTNWLDRFRALPAKAIAVFYDALPQGAKTAVDGNREEEFVKILSEMPDGERKQLLTHLDQIPEAKRFVEELVTPSP